MAACLQQKGHPCRFDTLISDQRYTGMISQGCASRQKTYLFEGVRSFDTAYLLSHMSSEDALQLPEVHQA